jgi:hypothetical protein
MSVRVFAKGAVLGFAWATGMSVAAAIGGREGKATLVEYARRKGWAGSVRADAEAARAEAARQAVAYLPAGEAAKWFGHWWIWRTEAGAVALAMNERGSHGDPETARQFDSLVSAIADARGDGE